MTNLEDTVTIQGKRIASLEGDVNTLKVDTSKLTLKLDHQEERQQERFNTLCTSQLELKDIMKARMDADEKRAEESRKYRAEREKQETEVQLQKQQWLQSILTPQTIIMIIIVFVSPRWRARRTRTSPAPQRRSIHRLIVWSHTL